MVAPLSFNNDNYVQQNGTNNPFDTVDAGQNSYIAKPTLADIDGDNDLDLIIGQNSGTLRYYQNTGDSRSASYSELTGSSNPLDGISVDSNAKPIFADIDGNGTLDLVVGEGGEGTGFIKYFKNTGSTTSPVYSAQSGSSNPFNSVGTNSYFTVPTLADIDGDDDLDLVVGSGYGNLEYHKNTGSTTAPVYTQQTGTSNPFDSFNVGANASPTFADVDNDGDLDAIVGEASSLAPLNYFENTGDKTNPNYAVRTGSDNPFNNLGPSNSNSTPILADLDNDKDLDLMIGDGYGTLAYFENPDSPGLLTPFSEDGAVEITNLGTDNNALQLLLEQVGVSDVSEILIYSADDAAGTNSQQIASFSLLGGGLLPDSYTPGALTLDSDLIEEGKFLQIKLVENSETRSSTFSARSDSEIAFDFGNGTILSLQPAIADATSNLVVGDAEAIDLSAQTGDYKFEFTVYREATYNNTVGFYTTDEANGAIITDTVTGAKLMPGDEGYKEAAIARQLETRLTGENLNVQTFTADIAGGSFLSTFLIADGTDVNSDQIYFSHLGANSNGNDHVKMLGNNTFGFEDMAGLGDKDYNDIVVQFSAIEPATRQIT